MTGREGRPSSTPFSAQYGSIRSTLTSGSDSSSKTCALIGGLGRSAKWGGFAEFFNFFFRRCRNDWRGLNEPGYIGAIIYHFQPLPHFSATYGIRGMRREQL